MKHVAPGSSQFPADRQYILLVMETLHYCRAELVFTVAIDNQLHTFADPVGDNARAVCYHRVALQRRLVIHGDIIEQGKHLGKHIGPGAVGVELDSETEIFNPVDQLFELRMKGGLTARDTDRIDPVFPAGDQCFQ